MSRMIDVNPGMIGRRMWSTRQAIKLLKAMDHAVYPPRCAACGSDRRPRASRGVPGRAGDAAVSITTMWYRAVAPMLCDDCRHRFIPVSRAICPVCGLPYPMTARGSHRCESCVRNMPPYDMARAAGGYHGALRELIQGLKFDGRTRVAEGLGQLLAAALIAHWDPAALDRVVPVPLYPRRLRHRGFNQADLLIRRMNPDRPVAQRRLPRLTVDRRLLIRTRHTRPQSGLHTGDRRRNVRNAFALRKGFRLDGEHILLVDDVMTTGATAAACAVVLKASGARRVDVLTLARTIPAAGQRDT